MTRMQKSIFHLVEIRELPHLLEIQMKKAGEREKEDRTKMLIHLQLGRGLPQRHLLWMKAPSVRLARNPPCGICPQRRL